MQQVNLGMIGGGTVGSGVFHAWQKNGALLAARLGVKLHFRKIAVKAFDEPRPYPIAKNLMTTDWQEGTVFATSDATLLVLLGDKLTVRDYNHHPDHVQLWLFKLS